MARKTLAVDFIAPVDASEKPMPTSTALKNRIVGSGTESPETLLANPDNVKIHPRAQRDAMEQQLEAVGWVQDVIVNQRTQRLIDGHMRVQIALDRDEPEIPVKYIDVSEEEERLLLATYDPIGALAATDQTKMKDLLAEVGNQAPKLQAVIDQLRGESERRTAGDFLSGVATPPTNVQFGDAEELTRVARQVTGETGDEEEEEEVPASTQGVYVQLSYAATPQQRGTIVQALNTAKTELGLGSSIEALTAICSEWMERHPQAE